MTRGQALVEMALVTPVLVALVLGGAEVGSLGVQRLAWQGSAGVPAEWAAMHPSDVPGPSWDALTAAETTRTGCGAPVIDADLSDGTRAVVTLTCSYRGLALGGLFDGLPVSVAGVGIIR